MTKKLGAATKTQLLPVDVRTATGNTAAIDIQDYDSDIEFIQYADQMTAGDTLTGIIQESDDGQTGWTAVTGGTFTVVTDAGPGFEVLTLKAPSLKRYVRYSGVIVGTSPSVAYGVMMQGFKKEF